MSSVDGWYTNDELLSMGFLSVGKDVLISKKISVYGAKNIRLGNNIRIDDYCVLACTNGTLVMEGYNHIGSYSYINSAGYVFMKLFSGLSSRCSVYSCTEHYDGSFLTNPTVPSQYINVEKSPIVFGKHCVVGTNSTVLLGCNLGDYSAVGAFSLVNKDVEFGAIVKGIPAKKYRDRDVQQLMKLEHSLMNATP